MRLSRIGFLTALGIAVLVFAGMAQAQYRNDPASRQVLSRMHHVNQMEIRLGELAMQKGRSQEVRDYGRTLRNDHQMSDRRVTNLAAREGIDLYRIAPSAHDRMVSRRLQRARGHAFDREFLNAMANGHAQVITELTRARRNVRNPEVRRLIGSTLPALREHRNMARDFQGQM